MGTTHSSAARPEDLLPDALGDHRRSPSRTWIRSKRSGFGARANGFVGHQVASAVPKSRKPACPIGVAHPHPQAPLVPEPSFDDGSTQTLDLRPLLPLPQKVAIVPITTASVKIRIDAVRRGTTYDDACLSEVAFVRSGTGRPTRPGRTIVLGLPPRRRSGSRKR